MVPEEDNLSDAGAVDLHARNVGVRVVAAEDTWHTLLPGHFQEVHSVDSTPCQDEEDHHYPEADLLLGLVQEWFAVFPTMVYRERMDLAIAVVLPILRFVPIQRLHLRSVTNVRPTLDRIRRRSPYTMIHPQAKILEPFCQSCRYCNSYQSKRYAVCETCTSEKRKRRTILMFLKDNTYRGLLLLFGVGAMPTGSSGVSNGTPIA